MGERIKQAMAVRGYRHITDLAKDVDESDARVGGWVRGKHDPTADMLPKLARVLQVTESWLAGEPGPMKPPRVAEPERPVYRTGTRYIPIYGPITAGSPAQNAGDVIEWYEMREWGGDFERWGRIVDGFSMEPHLEPGDFAIFENRRWDPGHVVHAYDAGEDTVKQVRRVDGKLWLCPTNPEYERIDGSNWNIKGVCIGYVRREPDGSVTLREYPQGMRPKSFL